MEHWNNIINTALLGTDKKQMSASELSSELAEVYEQIHANEALDKEEKFLQIAAVAFNYRQCGIAPHTDEKIGIKAAATEKKPYCNMQALQVLEDILEEQSHSLLKWWLQHCNTKEQIVVPEFIPALFGIAANQKKLRPLITACCGKRGEWLSSFNPDWNKFYLQESEEETWQNGTTEQRKIVLQQLREKDPAKGRAWLQQTWQSESANTKAELLKQLETNITADDIEWLESALEEKSQKIKEVALDLLKQIPMSSVITAYWNILQKTVVLKKEKVLLGMVNKTSLQIQLVNVDEAIFKTGIENLSNTKEFTDEEFIIYQLIGAVPPQNWEAHFNTSPEQIITFFQKDKSTHKYLPAFAKAIVQFNNKEWAAVLMQNSGELFLSSLLPLLPEQQQDEYSIKFFEKEPNTIIHLATNRATGWSLELTKTIFKHTAKDGYSYNRNFYSECIHLIPATVVGELEKFTPQQAYYQTMWSNMSEYIIKLITLKLQTTQAFQS